MVNSSNKLDRTFKYCLKNLLYVQAHACYDRLTFNNYRHILLFEMNI